MKDIIQQYLDHLQSGNAEKIIQLFSDDAIIHSPLYGNQLAKDFYKRLFADTRKSEITLLNLFNSIDKPDVFAAHFKYAWTLKNDAVAGFECVDVFHFNESGKIKALSIIYDTYNTRDIFETLS